MGVDRVRISTISVGQTYPKSLFSISGQRLLNADVAITDRHLQALKRCGEFEAYLADSPDELVGMGVLEPVDGSKLRVGQTARSNVVTQTGQVVLEPGQEIEQHHLEAMAVGGKSYATKDAASQRRERILLSDALVGELEQEIPNLQLRVQSNPAEDWTKPDEPALWPERPQLMELRSKMVETLRQQITRVEAGVTVPLAKFEAVADQLMDLLSRQPTRFTQLALLCPRRQDYLPDHAFTVAVLAMAIATRLSWPRKHVLDVGVAGFLADLGMLLIPERIRVGASQLSDIDRNRVHRHPVFSLSMMQAIDKVPHIIRLAALQHQERENGTGYPRGLRRDAICDFARVLAVADAYAATTEPRNYRHPKLPYVAMEETLRAASAMILWKPAAKAMIEAAGLFPVGSYLKLSDGRGAHVIAANPKAVDRPLVQPMDPEGRPKGPAVDLSQLRPQELNVLRPMASPTG